MSFFSWKKTLVNIEIFSDVPPYILSINSFSAHLSEYSSASLSVNYFISHIPEIIFTSSDNCSSEIIPS